MTQDLAATKTLELIEMIDDEMAALQKMHHLKTAWTQAWLATWIADAWVMQGGTIPSSFADLYEGRDELRAKQAQPHKEPAP